MLPYCLFQLFSFFSLFHRHRNFHKISSETPFNYEHLPCALFQAETCAYSWRESCCCLLHGSKIVSYNYLKWKVVVMPGSWQHWTGKDAASLTTLSTVPQGAQHSLKEVCYLLKKIHVCKQNKIPRRNKINFKNRYVKVCLYLLSFCLEKSQWKISINPL